MIRRHPTHGIGHSRGHPVHGQRAGGGGPAPSILAAQFANGEKGGILIPTPDKVFANTDGTGSVAVDSTFARIDSTFGNLSATQDTAGAQFALRQDAGGRYYYETAVGDFMEGNGDWAGWDDFHIIAVGKANDTDGGLAIFNIAYAEGNTFTGSRMLGYEKGDTFFAAAGNSTTNASTSADILQLGVYEAIFPKASGARASALNGGSYTTNTSSMDDATSDFALNVGKSSRNGEHEMYAVLCINRIITTDRAAVITALGALAGLTV